MHGTVGTLGILLPNCANYVKCVMQIFNKERPRTARAFFVMSIPSDCIRLSCLCYFRMAILAVSATSAISASAFFFFTSFIVPNVKKVSYSLDIAWIFVKYCPTPCLLGSYASPYTSRITFPRISSITILASVNPNTAVTCISDPFTFSPPFREGVGVGCCALTACSVE